MPEHFTATCGMCCMHCETFSCLSFPWFMCLSLDFTTGNLIRSSLHLTNPEARTRAVGSEMDGSDLVVTHVARVSSRLPFFFFFSTLTCGSRCQSFSRPFRRPRLSPHLFVLFILSLSRGDREAIRRRFLLSGRFRQIAAVSVCTGGKRCLSPPFFPTVVAH